MTEIPFFIGGADKNDVSLSKLPLYDLSEVNRGHFVLDCDNRNNLHYHGSGATFVYTEMGSDDFNEMNPNGLDMGANGRNMLGQNDKAEILQIDATGALPAEMERDQQRMVMLGGQLVTNNNQNETLGAKKIEASASDSVLKRISMNSSKLIARALDTASGFLGSTFENTYSINSQFSTDIMDAQTLSVWVSTVQAGIMPKEIIYNEARNQGVTEKDDEELEEMTQDDALDTPSMSLEDANAEIDSESDADV